MKRLVSLLLVALVPLLAVVPLRDALSRGQIAGAGPDVVTTLWTMWWFQQEWAGAAWGGHSTLFNFPFGGSGAILSPITAVTWAILEPLVGIGPAATLTALSQLIGFVGGVMLLARTLGLSRIAQVAAGIAVMGHRYLFFAVGETSVVGITALPLVFGLIGLVKLLGGDLSWRWRLLVAVCVPLQALENPYLAPVLPGLLALMVLLPRQERPRRVALGSALLVGVVGVALTGLLHAGATSSAYESARPYGTVGPGSLQWAVIERPWSRAGLGAMLWPVETRWSTSAQESIHAAGREYLGLTGLLLAGLAAAVRPRSALPWIGLAVVGIALATGSDWLGLPGPFALLNTITIRLVRGLTQPTRYLMLAAIGLPIAAGIGAGLLWERRRLLGGVAVGLLLLDATTLGGLSLRLPSMSLPGGDCVESLQDTDGAVLVWPWDGIDDIDMDATLHSRLFQLRHGRPGATVGTGSWPLVGGVFPGHVLRELGWSKAIEGKGKLDVQTLADWGFRHVVLDTSVPDPQQEAAMRTFRRTGIVTECDGARIFSLPDPTPGAGPPAEHPSAGFVPQLSPEHVPDWDQTGVRGEVHQ
ncbi:MAG: hypothetical protein ACI8RZ_007568 [Myxococcota bacterium]